MFYNELMNERSLAWLTDLVNSDYLNLIWFKILFISLLNAGLGVGVAAASFAGGAV